MDNRPADSAEKVLNRIWSEYLEMPGLSLTARQAERLWALDEVTCRDLMDILVDRKMIVCRKDGRYLRANAGR
jgi:hypothetical protein